MESDYGQQYDLMSLILYSALDFLGKAAEGIKEILNGLKAAETESR